MSVLSENGIYCPYCGEYQTVLVDPEDIGGSYTEDCQICCRPMVMTLHGDGAAEVTLDVRREDD